jgi:hypothetical protein
MAGLGPAIHVTSPGAEGDPGSRAAAFALGPGCRFAAPGKWRVESGNSTTLRRSDSLLVHQARVILVAPASAIKQHEGTGRRVTEPKNFLAGFPASHARRFLSSASRIFEGPVWRFHHLTPLKPSRGGPVILPDGRATRRFASSTRAGFAAHGSREDTRLQRPPEARLG